MILVPFKMIPALKAHHRTEVFVTLCLPALLLTFSAKAQDPVPQLDQSHVQQLLAEGDRLSQTVFDYKQALAKYVEALGLASNDYEILRRISREYVNIGDHLPARTNDEKDLQLEDYKKALEYANKAIDANRNGSAGFTRRAIANGRIALFRIGWESIGLAKQIRADLERAIEIDSSNDLAWYVLGRTHLKVSEWPKFLRWPVGLGWASLEDAVSSFEKAVALSPKFIMYRLDCARAYIALGQFSQARIHLTTIPSLPTAYQDDDQFRKEAEELQQSIREK
jgi:tetratricopeptide (TPR) repeat protein